MRSTRKDQEIMMLKYKNIFFRPPESPDGKTFKKSEFSQFPGGYDGGSRRREIYSVINVQKSYFWTIKWASF